jgi:hypothetical protein
MPHPARNRNRFVRGNICQAKPTRGAMVFCSLEVGYVDAHGTHLQRFRSLNQALSASREDPVNGQTANTLANIGLRVPIPGIPLREAESEGSFLCNGLEVSLTKRLSHGLQFLASYTFSKTLDTDGTVINGTSAGNTLTLGNQKVPIER